MTLPDSLSYHVVYDMSRRPPSGWLWPVIPLLIVGVLMRFTPRPKARWHPALRRFLVGFAFVMTFIGGVAILTQYLGLRKTLASGDVRVVEGTVTDFIPQKPILKHPEQFVVVTPSARYKYSYSSNLGNGGMNKSKGRIRNGVRVRIADRDGVILRLEVARDASGSTLTPELAKRFPEVEFLPEIFLRIGYTANLGFQNGMEVRFVDVVSDTRPSLGRRGDAVAIVDLFDSGVGRQPIRLELHTNRELYPPFSDGDLVVDLTNLTSASETNHTIVKSDYIARLKIGRTLRPEE